MRNEFEWMRRYAFGYFRTFVPDPAEADDFCQDILESFIGRLKERGELNRSFFMHMVRFGFLDRMRAYRRDVLRQRVREPHPSDADPPLDGILDTLAANDGRSPQETALLTQSFRAVFNDVLNTFKPHQQRVILRRLMGFPAREIHESLREEHIEMTANHINVLFHKFKSLVRDACRDHELQPE